MVGGIGLEPMAL